MCSLAWLENNAYQHSDGNWYDHAEDDGVKNYHGSDGFRFTPTRKGGKTLVGIELEVELPSSTHRLELAKAIETYQYIQCEKDGSLDEYKGLEIITAPRPYGKAVDVVCDVCALTRRYGAAGHDAGTNYGLHVNLCRAAYSGLIWAKVLAFLHWNKAFCAVVGQRVEGYNSAPDTPFKRPATRYTWLNLTGTRAEFRLFRSNTRKDRILKSIQFCIALCEFCRNTPLTGKGLRSEGEFLEFLQKNKKEYPDLYSFIAEKNLVRKEVA